MANTAKHKILALASIGIDIGKDVFHLVGFDADGKIVLRRKIKRLALIATFEKLLHCIVGMEACLSAHFVSRILRRLGIKPRIIPAKYTKPLPSAIFREKTPPEAWRRVESLRIGNSQ